MQQMYRFDPYRTQLELLFVYYCSFGDKESVNLLKIQNYRRLFTDMQLYEQRVNPNHPSLIAKCDVIFYSKSAPNSSLTFKAFLQILQPIASFFYPQEPLQKLVKFHIEPLYDHIIKDTQFGQSASIISPVILKEVCYHFLQKFQSSLNKIYQHYFVKSGKEGQNEQFKIFMKLSRQLGFVPKTASKPIAYLIFTFLRNRDSKIAFKLSSWIQTKYKFDFICFIDYMIILSHIGRRGQQSQRYKIYYLLQAMQVSQGYRNIQKIVKIQHFFVPNNQLQEPVRQSKQFNNESKSIEKRHFQIIVQTPLRKKLGEYFDPLKERFMRLCTKKHVESNFYLKESVAIKMLTQICPRLTQSTCEELISTVGRLNFQNFVALINNVAQRLKIDRQNLYSQVSGYIEGISNMQTTIQNTYLQEEENIKCNEIFRLAHSYLKNIFDFYQFAGTVSLSNYLTMLNQTQITPKIIDTVQASNIYSSCQKTKGLNYQQFQLSLFRVILLVNFQNELEGVERLLYLLQTICKSKRGQTLMKKNMLMIKEHPLYKIRLMFQNQYRTMYAKLQQK